MKNKKAGVRVLSGFLILVFGFSLWGCGSQSGGTPETTTTTTTTSTTSTSASSTSTSTTTTTLDIVTPAFNPSNVSVEVVVIGGNTVSREVMNNTVVVTLGEGKTKSELIASLPAGYSLAGDNAVTGVYEISSPAGKTLAEAISEVGALSTVSGAGHDVVLKTYYTPNDPYFNTAYFTDRWPFISSEATWAWDLITGEPRVLIAVLDSGLDLSHSEFTGRTINGPDYVDGGNVPEDTELFGHGTEVAGLAAATGNNGSLMAGMNWHAPVLIVRVCSQEGGSTNALANAVTYVAETYGLAYDGVIINTSVGVELDSGNSNDAVLINALSRAAAACSRNNVLWVTPVGNENIDIDSTPVYPAALSQIATMPVISVGGHNRAGERWSGTYAVGFKASNYGNGVDVCAAGGEILTTSFYSNVTANQWGTSLSSPLVAGGASLIKSLFNAQSISLTPVGLIEILKDGGDTISADHPIGKKLNLKGTILNGLGLHSKTVLSIACSVGGASIAIDGTSSGKETTTEGYTRVVVAEGSRTVSISKSGYTTSSNTISCTAGEEEMLSVTLSPSVTSFITGETNSYFTIDNGRFYIRTNYDSSSTRNILNQIGLSGQSTWLKRAIYPSPCITQSEPFWTGSIINHSLSLLTNTSTLAAYQTQFTVTSESKALRVTWKFIVPVDKDYAIWVCSYESVGTDKTITVDNPSGYTVQDIYFCYPIQPTTETGAYITCEGDAVPVAWSASSATDYYNSSNRHFSVYNSDGCLTFGYFGDYCSSNPYLYYLNSEMGYKSMLTTTYSVSLSAAAPTKQWIGVLAFSNSVANAGSLYADALTNLNNYLSAVQ
ncbi:MAG: S8 family serine peptidase [Candidatus Margulisbacteria bacterium]|nr:S8 family serine peptidase [Candidatus Margulisiibacteriota bacterium]